MNKTKKGQEEPKKVILGRPGNNLKIGLVGLPNVGKSSTYNLLSKLQVPAENFMFCTINPNKAKVEVPDERFTKLCEIFKPKSEVPASLTVLDIAGLVKGASEGQGMGNDFLSHIQSVDGIFHVVRSFDDEEVLHYEGDVDPVRDLEIIQNELLQKDIKSLDRIMTDLRKSTARANNKEIKEELEILEKVKALFENNQSVRHKEDWHYKEIAILNKHLFFTAKPVVYLINLSEKDYARKKNKWLPKIINWVKENGGGKTIPFSVEYEQKILNDPASKTEGVESALPKIINAGYNSLDLLHYFTCGADEVRCWTIRNGILAPGAAGVIHTDFERGFISADVMKYDDLVKLGGEQEVKKAGLMRCEGKNYEVKDGDIIHFKFNVSDPNKKKK